jgi:hypothetical protein
MNGMTDALRTRIFPAVLTAAGVALVTAGLLTYTGPVEADPGPTPEPTLIAASPSPSPTPTPTPRLSPSFPATVSPTPQPSATFPADRLATRVIIPAMEIDLPVIRQPDPTYPACNVAMYYEHPALGQPGQGKATYLYAHAQRGMFLSLLEESKRNNGERMKGMYVFVYTSDERLFVYEITQVLRHQTTLDRPLAATSEELWLQTSEQPAGPPGVVTPKLQLVARPLSEGPVSDPVEAHPTARPVDCH